MVKYIIHCGDLHIRNFQRTVEYQEQLKKFVDECKAFCDKHGTENVRIVITGDLVHSKTTISNECNILTSWFLRELDDIAKTIVIAGNHDITTNMDRIDSLTPIFSMCRFKQIIYLDQYLEYQSGCFVDDNIVWCLYSSFSGFIAPNIDNMRTQHKDKTFVGLCHCGIQGSKTDAGYVSEVGVATSHFEDVDFCLLGHIHKRQCIKHNGIKLAYCGSLIQQDHGENIANHGYLVWDVDECDYTEHNIENNDYGFYTFTINDEEDVDKNKEEIINL